MTSIFRQSMENGYEEPEPVEPIFSQFKPHKTENIIPPIGLAKPSLIESFQQNLGNEENILKEIADEEAYERETLPQTIGREISSHATRFGEGYLGGINQFLNLTVPELYQDEEGNPYEPGKEPQGLPGPQQLHEITKAASGKYLEPKGEKTKISQEIASDVGSMFSTGGLGFLAKLFIPVGGQVVKQGIKYSGGSEKSQEVGKLGFMTLASMANLGNAHKAAAEAYQDAARMMPQGLSFSAKPTQIVLDKIKKSPWYKTGSTPSKVPAMKEIERIEGLIKNGKINGRESIQLRKDINEARRELGSFKWDKPADSKQALKYLDEIDSALYESINSYGEKFNPQWLQKYKSANEAYAVTRRSKLISDVIEKSGKPFKSDITKHLFYAGGAGALTQLPIAATVSLPVVGSLKTIQIMNRMIRSKVLRNHYLDVLRSTATGNSTMILKAIEKFDKAAEKIEDKNSQ